MPDGSACKGAVDSWGLRSGGIRGTIQPREEIAGDLFMSRVLSLLLVFALAGVAQAQAQPEPLVKKVKTSIAKGVAFVISQQRADGSWEEIKDKDNLNHYH